MVRGRGASTLISSISRPLWMTRIRSARIERLVDVVGDEEDGAAPALVTLAPECQKDAVELVLGDVVEGAEGLVQHQDAGSVGEDGGDRDALQHPAGELARPGALDMGRPTISR